MASTTKARKPNVPQAPRSRPPESRGGKRWLPLAAGATIIVVGIAVFAFQRHDSLIVAGGSSAGLPNTPDYHSLIISPTDTRELILGTHQGLYRSMDGGRQWTSYTMGGQDAMNLIRPTGRRTTWLAGHDIFARSDDGGQNWKSLQPATLPSLDLHGFAVDPRHPSTLYAAVAGYGLYRSTNSGASFKPVSHDVGGMVMALAVSPTGTIFAGDMQRGLLASRDGGKTWQPTLKASLAGIAIDPKNPQVILATGPGIFRSTDGGTTWSQVSRLASGAGPVAWSPSNPRLAYVVGFDRTLYRSSDAGATWSPVS